MGVGSSSSKIISPSSNGAIFGEEGFAVGEYASPSLDSKEGGIYSTSVGTTF